MSTKLLSALVLLTLPAAATAATVTIGTASDKPAYQSSFGIRADTATRGVDLVGMKVSAAYTDGTTEDTTWESANDPTRPAFGGVAGTGFTLDFGFAQFELSASKSLASLALDARTGNAIFDIIGSRAEGQDTPGTKIGFPFEISGGSDLKGVIDVTYSSAFSIAGAAPAPDAFTHMLIDFTGLENGGLNSDLNFRTDLDSLEVAGDFAAVPLPASIVMFLSAFGILGAGALRKRKG